MYLTSVTTKIPDQNITEFDTVDSFDYVDNTVHHETYGEALEAYENALQLDNLYSAQLCKIISSTEPHHMIGFEGKTKDYQQIPINNLEDVRAFIKYCIDEMELNFHPDTDFKDYVELSGEPAFNPDETTVLDQKVYISFKICADAKVDIYDMAVEEFNKIHNL